MVDALTGMVGSIPGEWAEHPGRPCADPALGTARQRGAIFFPSTSQSTAYAVGLCLRCPVRVECLDYALDSNQHYGIWGGTSESERRRLRRRRRAAS